MKVFVALSGGVDSAVSAALLKKQGYAVVGVHMKMWHLASQSSVCTWQQDMEAAREAAQYLEIPFEVWDFTKEYQKAVVDYLFEEYNSGRTPNPDVMCNRHIKFGLFFDRAIAEGADYAATGHYARIKSQISNLPARQAGLKSQNYYLYRGVDHNKDQSYFLWGIELKKLSKILFPVGEMTKQAVREYAVKIGLPNANRKDSQGICFVGKLNMVEFLKLQLPEKVGEVVTTSGEVVGKHKGSWFYTIGQRHGWSPQIANKSPMYIVEKDVVKNRLEVAPIQDESLYASDAVINPVNWLVDPSQLSIINLPARQAGYQLKELSIQARYRQPPVKGKLRITKDSKGLAVTFAEPVRAVAPGQSVVVYEGNKVVGGGIIETAH